jgi:hypothetical protein
MPVTGGTSAKEAGTKPASVKFNIPLLNLLYELAPWISVIAALTCVLA